MGEPAVAFNEDELDAFLAAHAASSMYLRALLRQGGQAANFAVARAGGRIVAAAAQAPNGMVQLQAPDRAGQLAAAVLRQTGRRLAGFFGPAGQVRCALRELGLGEIALLKNTDEDLFSLRLADVRLPPVLASGQASCRVALAADGPLLVAWRRDFRRAVLNDVDGDQLDAASHADVAALLPAGSLFILEADRPLACCSFNARLPDIIQVGNVWTPPQLRGNGYARAVVAGALAMAAKGGVATAVLSTGRHSLAAQAAYRAIGFTVVGDYATVRIAPETELPALLS